MECLGRSGALIGVCLANLLGRIPTLASNARFLQGLELLAVHCCGATSSAGENYMATTPPANSSIPNQFDTAVLVSDFSTFLLISICVLSFFQELTRQLRAILDAARSLSKLQNDPVFCLYKDID